ncbi:MAG: hypothetical protein ACREP4_05975 [Stenotrophomonas sp.]|uniref:hypothetical protein n=1 Tax=Stenotrophomonas sp. TaxID=69392 RepID=UPI003D6D0100
MKKITQALALTATLTAATFAQAQSLVQIPDPPQVSQRVDASTLALPVGVQLVELHRYYNSKEANHWSGREMPRNWQDLGWRHQGSLGFISYTSFSGGHALYNCFIAGKNDFFTSPDPNCEGKNLSTWMPILGYVADTQIPGTVPLYRCMRGYTPSRADHFDTLSSACENVPNKALDGIIGYVFL